MGYRPVLESTAGSVASAALWGPKSKWLVPHSMTIPVQSSNKADRQSPTIAHVSIYHRERRILRESRLPAAKGASGVISTGSRDWNS